MADQSEQAIIEQADRAAEQAAAAARNGGSAENAAAMRAANDPERSGALDDVFNEVTSQQPPEFKGELGTENNGVRMPIEGEPKGEAPEAKAAREAEEARTKAEADQAAAAKAATTQEPAEGKKGLLDSLLSEETAPAAAKPNDPPADPYGDVKLRSDASPKTRETFEQLKTLAKQREDQARQEAVEVRRQLEETNAKLAELEKRTVPAEVETELKELREFRAQFGAEHSPEFRAKYNGRIDGNYSAIYDRLKTHGLPDTEVQKLQGFSETERDAAIESFLEKLPASSRRFIELKLADNLNVQDERAKALAEARGKAAELLAKEKQAPAEQAHQRYLEVAAKLKPAVLRLPWLHPKDVPQTASPEEKKSIEAHNKFALEAQESLKFVLGNDTADARAEAAIAVPLAMHLRRENASLSQQLAAVTKELNDIKAAGRITRTARSVASPNPAAPAAPKVEAADSGDALDSIFNEVSGARR